MGRGRVVLSLRHSLFLAPSRYQVVLVPALELRTPLDEFGLLGQKFVVLLTLRYTKQLKLLRRVCEVAVALVEGLFELLGLRFGAEDLGV